MAVHILYFVCGAWVGIIAVKIALDSREQLVDLNGELIATRDYTTSELIHAGISSNTRSLFKNEGERNGWEKEAVTENRVNRLKKSLSSRREHKTVSDLGESSEGLLAV